MRRRPYRCSPGPVPLDAVLPDVWPDNNPEAEGALLLQAWCGIPDWSTWRHVTLIGRDPLAIEGIRHLLARHGNIRLRVHKSPPASGEALSEHTDVVIWVRTKADGLPDLASHVARLCRRYPMLRQLVVSDFLPAGMAGGPAPVAGVWMAGGREKVAVIDEFLKLVLNTTRRPGQVLTKRLSRMQWRVLLMRASGADTRAIAGVFGIAMKTVYIHETAIRERLGLQNRMEYAWLLRSMALITEAMPALKRRTPGGKEAKS